MHDSLHSRVLDARPQTRLHGAPRAQRVEAAVRRLAQDLEGVGPAVARVVAQFVVVTCQVVGLSRRWLGEAKAREEARTADLTNMIACLLVRLVLGFWGRCG